MNHPLSATYRIQLHPGFSLDDAAGITDYLQSLGISHAYTSPFLQAAPGSTHGYDVVDHSLVNIELGGERAFDRFVGALSVHQMGLVVDLIPNHMAISTLRNRWWADVLKTGPRATTHRSSTWNGNRQKRECETRFSSRCWKITTVESWRLAVSGWYGWRSLSRHVQGQLVSGQPEFVRVDSGPRGQHSPFRRAGFSR